jgi:AraC-like DNA-binding protein
MERLAMAKVLRGECPPRDPFTSDARIRAAALSGFSQMLKSYDLDPAPILAKVSIAPHILEDQFNWLPLEKFALALTLAAQATGDQCFGLKYGSTTNFANPLGYLIASAPDLKTALRSFIHYQRVFNSNVASLSEPSGAARIEWTYPVTMCSVTQLTDFVLMRFMRRIQSAAGPSWRSLSVGVTHHEPSDREEYERRLGARIVFDQSYNSIVIASATLNLPMPNADPNLFNLVARFCEQELAQQKSEEDPLNRVRDAILRCLQRGSISPRRVADELGVTPGSLHRLLKSQGTSFQRLFDDTRRRLAHRYLFESSLTLTDIAQRVGYSELSAFSRAARRWFGASPRSIRRNQTKFGEAA